jgi:hypothetical protein
MGSHDYHCGGRPVPESSPGGTSLSVDVLWHSTKQGPFSQVSGPARVWSHRGMYQMSNEPVSGNYQLALLDLLSNAEQTTIGGVGRGGSLRRSRAA